MKKYVAIINNKFTINVGGGGGCYYKECGLKEVREYILDDPLLYFNENSTLEDVKEALIENCIIDDEIKASEIESVKLVEVGEFLYKIPKNDKYSSEIILK